MRRLTIVAVLAGCGGAEPIAVPQDAGVQDAREPTEPDAAWRQSVEQPSGALEQLADCEASKDAWFRRSVEGWQVQAARKRREFAVDCASPAPKVVPPDPPLKTVSRLSTPSAAPAVLPELAPTDGAYLYYPRQQLLHVFEAPAGGVASRVARVRLAAGAPTELEVRGAALAGERLVVFYEAHVAHARSACYAGADCSLAGDGESIDVSIFDVSNPADPIRLHQLHVYGSLLAARLTGNTLHMAIHADPFGTSQVYAPVGLPACGEPSHVVDREYEWLHETFVGSIVRADMHHVLPVYSGGPFERRAPPDCSAVYASATGLGNDFVSLISFDLDAGRPRVSSVLGRPSAVALSDDRFVLLARSRGPAALDEPPAPEESVLHTFSIAPDPAATRYLGTLRLPGSPTGNEGLILEGDSLRALTRLHTGARLTTLRSTPDGFTVVDGLDLPMPRAVHLAGARGYLQSEDPTQPIDVLALTRDAGPHRLGSLGPLGITAALAPIDDERVLSFGYAGDPSTPFGSFEGVRLALYTLSDPTLPPRVEDVRTRGANTAASTSALAFDYLPAQRLAVLPLSVCEPDGALSFAGLSLWKVEPAFGESIRVAHDRDPTRCTHWWTAPRGSVIASRALGDHVFSFTADEVRIQSTPDAQPTVIEFQGRPCEQGGRTVPDGALLLGDCANCLCDDGELDCDGEKCI